MTRRLVPTLLALVALAGPGGAAAVTGHVFVDENRDGAFDPGDRPLPKVLVSAWDRTTVTDAQGAYRLEVEPGTHVVHPSWPSGVWPAAMPFWRQVEVGAEDGQADFPFQETDDELPFYIVQLTDTHATRDQLPRLRQACELVNGLRPRPLFAINTGDLGWAGGTSSDAQAETMWREHYLAGVEGLDVPLFHAPGNHDYGGADSGQWAGPRRLVGRGGYRRYCGPLNYAFAHAGWHIVVIEGATPRIPPEKHIEPVVPQATLRWLRAYLDHVSRWEPKVLFSHYDPNAMAGNREKLADLLKGRDFRRIYAGHDHREERTEFAYIPVVKTAALSGAWWAGHNPSGDAQGFRIIQADAARALRSAYVCPWRDHHIQLDQPDPAHPLRGTAEIVATVFDPQDTVLGVMAGFDTRRSPAAVAPRGPWKEIATHLPTGGLADGEHDLWIVVRRLGGVPTARVVPVVVANEEPKPFRPRGAATLHLRARGVDAHALVLVNGQKAGTIPAGAGPRDELSFAVPEDVLAHVVTSKGGKPVPEPATSPVATVAFRPGAVQNEEGTETDVFQVADISMHYDGETHHDVRTAGRQFVAVRSVWYLRPRCYEARIRLAGRRRFQPHAAPSKEFEGGVYLRLRAKRGAGPMAELALRYATITRTPRAMGLVIKEGGEPILHVQTEGPHAAFRWTYVYGPWGVEMPTYHAVLALLSGDETLSRPAVPPPR
ncbi:MAG: metallophosphoesterase [Candidatus Brocadiia bacterium]